MKKCVFILFLAGFAFGLAAQVSSGSNGTAPDGSLLLDYDVGYRGVKGTPSLFADWREGKAWLKNGSEINGVLMNYDLMENVVRLRKSEEGAVLTLLLEKIEKIWFKEGDQWREWVSIPPSAFEKAPKEKYLYELLIVENRQLLKRESKQFMEADYRRPFSSGENYDEFVSSAEYFLKNKEGKYEKIKLRQGAILRALCDRGKKKAAREYIRVNELWARDEATAIRLIRYLTKE